MALVTIASKTVPSSFLILVAMPGAPSSVLVTTSKALVTSSDALVPSSFLVLVAMQMPGHHQEHGHLGGLHRCRPSSFQLVPLQKIWRRYWQIAGVDLW